MLIIAAFVIGLGEPAPEALEPGPTLDVFEPDDASIDQVKVVQQVAPDHVKVTLTFRISTYMRGNNDLRMPIDVPRDAAIVGLTLELDGKTCDARFAYAPEALRTYDRIVNVEKDPALLGFEHSTETHDRYRLRVFPVTHKAAATVTIYMVVDRTTALALGAGVVPDENVVKQTTNARPKLGLGKQVGKHMSLIATDGNARPEGYRLVAIPSLY